MSGRKLYGTIIFALNVFSSIANFLAFTLKHHQLNLYVGFLGLVVAGIWLYNFKHNQR